MAWPKGVPRNGFKPAKKRSIETTALIPVDPFSNGHIPSKRMVGHCFMCADYFAGRTSYRLIVVAPQEAK